MERQNCCKDCADRTDGCHSKCADYAALKAEFAAKREHLKLNRNPADEVLGQGARSANVRRCARKGGDLMRPRYKFTASEDQYLRENYKTKPTAELSQQLGRSYQSVWKRCKILNIVPIKGSIDGRPKVWKGCQETCPFWCPYNDCMKP